MKNGQQDGTSNGGQGPYLNSGFLFRRGWPRRSPKKIMCKLIPLLVSVVISLSSSHGQEITAKVFNPTDVYPPSYSPEFAGKPVIYDFMKPLILQLQQAKPGDFISAAGAKDTLKWRLQHFTIISGDIVAVKFTEGHIDVIGIFTRNTAKKQWELATAVGGHFKTKIYDEITGEPKQEGEQDVHGNTH